MFEKYDASKDSGVEWLGEIPKHWQLISLKRLVKFQVGGTPSTSDSKAYDGDLPWVTIADLSGRYTNKFHYISKRGVRLANIPLTPKGSLLYSFKLSIGQVAFADRDLYTNEAIATFISSGSECSEWLYYMLPIFLERNAATNIYGAKILNQDLIKNACILDVPLSEQMQISNFLDKRVLEIEQAIAIKEQQIALFNEHKQIVIQKAVTQGLNPNVPMNDSGVEWIGEIPEHWEVKKLKYVLEERSQRSRDGLEPLLMMSQTHGLVVRSEYSDKAEVAATTVGNKLVYHNDLVFNKLKAHLGVFFGSVHDFVGSVSPDYAVYKPVKYIENSKFLELLFRNPLYIKQFILRSSGIVEGLIRLYTTELFDLKIAIPPNQEQKDILNFVEQQSVKFDKVIENYIQQIEKLKEYKTTLINDAVTGKIKVA